MKTSESIKEIAGAICKMQAALKPADKDNTNPAYKSKYSDINNVWETLRHPLTSNGLSVWQDATTLETGVSVTTRVVHNSGEWIEFGPFIVPLGAKRDAHGFGSCCTYAKRYSLCAALGVTSSDDDDDGNASCSTKPQTKNILPPSQPSGDMTKEEALRKLSSYGNDSTMILQFLLNRCDRFKSFLIDEVDSFIQSGDLAMAEFCLWRDTKFPQKVK